MSATYNDIDFDDDWYDEDGKPTPNGIYDAGGHMDGERAADRADWVRDMMRDMDV